jgi:hypothetical protein
MYFNEFPTVQNAKEETSREHPTRLTEPDIRTPQSTGGFMAVTFKNNVDL